jgi:hypothetical protein
MKRKIGAGILLVLLLGVPFINWRLGAVLWMCAWLVFILQNTLSRRNWHLGTKNEDKDTPDEQH